MAGVPGHSGVACGRAVCSAAKQDDESRILALRQHVFELKFTQTKNMAEKTHSGSDTLSFFPTFMTLES